MYCLHSTANCFCVVAKDEDIDDDDSAVGGNKVPCPPPPAIAVEEASMESVEDAEPAAAKRAFNQISDGEVVTEQPTHQ